MIMKLHNARKSISSYEISRELCVTQKTAYRHLLKLRKCLFTKQLADLSKLKGPVQYDEKIIQKAQSLRILDDNGKDRKIYRVEKALVAVLVDAHSGKIRHLTVGNHDENKLTIVRAWIKNNVEEGAILLMDSADHLNELAQHYNIMKVHHSAHEFARKTNHPIMYKDSNEKYDLLVTNNAVEGFWARLSDQTDVTYQHRFDIKNLPYYLSDAVNRLEPGGRVENGLGVAMTTLLSACVYDDAKHDDFNKRHDIKDYLSFWGLKTGLNSKSTKVSYVRTAPPV